MPQLRERSAAVDDVADVRGEAEPPATPDGVPITSPAAPTPRLMAEPAEDEDADEPAADEDADEAGEDGTCEDECAPPPLRDGTLAAVEVVPAPEERAPPLGGAR
jgi:hypothetical protein